jgi:aminoglycoside phosphotransferase (APT) family kinase protein
LRAGGVEHEGHAMRPEAISDEQLIVEAIERISGGSVRHVERLPRWRAGWFVDASCDGVERSFYLRGERGPDFPSPYSLEHEVAVHRLLEDHAIPVPHVYAVIELHDTHVMVMDRIPGHQGLEFASSDDARQSLLLTCMDYIVQMHRLDMNEVAQYGFELPRSAEDIVLSQVFRRLEDNYLGDPWPLDPVIEFLRLWLRRNQPDGRTQPAFVTWDSAQFLHDQDVLTAFIDFELAHVGDPYMDLAPLRSRDSFEPFGDLHGAFRRYEEVTGTTIDYEVLRYYEISQLTATLMLQRPVIIAPHSQSDYVTHLMWYIESARYAFDVMAELLHVDLDALPSVSPGSPSSGGYAHLLSSLRRKMSEGRDREGTASTPEEEFARWQARADYRVARHLAQIDLIGDAIEEQQLDDAAELLGQRPGDLPELDAMLVDLVTGAGPDRDVELLGHLERRMQRQQMQIAPAGAAATRHNPLQPLPDRKPRSG